MPAGPRTGTTRGSIRREDHRPRSHDVVLRILAQEGELGLQPVWIADVVAVHPRKDGRAAVPHALVPASRDPKRAAVNEGPDPIVEIGPRPESLHGTVGGPIVED